MLDSFKTAPKNDKSREKCDVARKVGAKLELNKSLNKPMDIM